MTLPRPIPYDEYNPSSSTIAMFYGTAGTGKTEIAAASDTPEERTLIVSIGSGMTTIKSPGFRSRNPNSKPDVVEVFESITNRGFIESPKAFDTVCDVLDFQLEHNLDKYKNYVIDDMTSLRRFALMKGLDVNAATGLSASLAISKKMKTNIVAIQDFGREMSLISQFIAGYSDIMRRHSKNLIMLAHERLYYRKGNVGEPATLYRIRPAFTGEKFPDEITQFFDLIGFNSVKTAGDKQVFTTKFAPDSMIVGKNRWSGLIVPNSNGKETYNNEVKNFKWQEFQSAIKNADPSTYNKEI